ncbi:acyl carrier protein [Nonomuraea sp. NPDC050328]|uniref:acyl carrier protein n=1 Tax=Nonomuraea sp. NPDC050328 TaxID=3364361 RepID=UPI0037935EC5
MNDESAAIASWLCERIALYVDCEAGEIAADAPLVELGVDSVYVLGITSEIQDRYGIDVDPSAIWEHSTVSDLSTYLHKCLGER